MYYLVKREELPEDLRGKYYESVPDGRIIVDGYTIKVCSHLTDVEIIGTAAKLDDIKKGMSSGTAKPGNGTDKPSTGETETDTDDFEYMTT